jgi:hypothetical protein
MPPKIIFSQKDDNTKPNPKIKTVLNEKQDSITTSESAFKIKTKSSSLLTSNTKNFSKISALTEKKSTSVLTSTSTSISTATALSKPSSKLTSAVLKIQTNLTYTISVPENEGYEIENGLPDMKRDINLKLVYYLDESKIRQVFYNHSFFSFTLIFLVICNKRRIFPLEKSFSIYYIEAKTQFFFYYFIFIFNFNFNFNLILLFFIYLFFNFTFLFFFILLISQSVTNFVFDSKYCNDNKKSIGILTTNKLNLLSDGDERLIYYIGPALNVEISPGNIKYIHNYAVNRLRFQWSREREGRTGTIQSVRVSTGIYRLFVN